MNFPELLIYNRLWINWGLLKWKKRKNYDWVTKNWNEILMEARLSQNFTIWFVWTAQVEWIVPKSWEVFIPRLAPTLSARMQGNMYFLSQMKLSHCRRKRKSRSKIIYRTQTVCASRRFKHSLLPIAYERFDLIEWVDQKEFGAKSSISRYRTYESFQDEFADE